MRNIYRALFMALITGLFIMQSVPSYADWNGHGGGRGYGGWHGHSYAGIGFSVWPDDYYYGVPYYYPDDVLVSPPIYQPVVQQPVEVVQSPTVIDSQYQGASPEITTAGTMGDTPDSITINIPNDKGGYTAVILKKSGNGFIGPQGEFYPEFPKVSQLKIIYGK